MKTTGTGFNIIVVDNYNGDRYEMYSTESLNQIFYELDNIINVSKTLKKATSLIKRTFNKGYMSNLPTIKLELFKKTYGGIGFESNIYRHFLLLKDGEVIDYIKDNCSFREVYMNTVAKNNGDTLVVIPFEVVSKIYKVDTEICDSTNVD